MDFDLRGLIENSLLEWEDKVAAVVIAGGCNLRCPFCHSWRYVVGVDGLERRDPEELFRLLERQRGWIDGVVFTGGEPTLQPGLPDMLRRTRDCGVKIKLHTNGTRPEAIRALADEKLLDCLALDYKAPLDARYFAAAGIEADDKTTAAVRESFALARETGIDREYHTTLCPAFVDAEAFRVMADWLEPDGLWILQQYENDDCLDASASGRRRYDGKELDMFKAMAEAHHGRVILKKGKSE